jgi:hypothetical protein
MNNQITGSLLIPAPKAKERKINLKVYLADIRRRVNGVLPVECRIRTTSDAWYCGAVAAVAVGLVLPYALPVALACVVMAQRKGGEHE